MNTKDQQQNQLLQDRLGRQIAARLSADSGLSHEVSERLRAARVRALARRKVVSTPVLGVTGGVATLGFDAGQPGFWGRLASALPLVALAAGLVAINVIQNENRAEEVAEVDAALLTDDLPPAAYADPGFMQFLNSAG
nr:DUF3619 family protein [Ramlibacter sp.]